MHGYWLLAIGEQEHNPKNLCESVAKKSCFVEFVQFVAKKNLFRQKPLDPNPYVLCSLLSVLTSCAKCLRQCQFAAVATHQPQW